MKNKKALEFSFGWIFAILAGAFIILLAVIISQRLIATEKKAGDTMLAKEVGISLISSETALESSKLSKINFQTETRFFFDCNSVKGPFGEQRIKTSTKMPGNKQWNNESFEQKFPDKYIFSSRTIEGKTLTVFSKPFNFPYKIADLLFIFGNETYCFVNPPPAIEYEISSFSLRLINISDAIENCQRNSKKVCFYSSNPKCDIKVDLDAKSVEKDSKKVYFEDYFDTSLLYASIFSDAINYECQLKRLMKRNYQLTSLYLEKTNLLSSIGCNSGLTGELNILKTKLNDFSSSLEIRRISQSAKEIEYANKQLSCPLY